MSASRSYSASNWWWRRRPGAAAARRLSLITTGGRATFRLDSWRRVVGGSFPPVAFLAAAGWPGAGGGGGGKCFMERIWASSSSSDLLRAIRISGNFSSMTDLSGAMVEVVVMVVGTWVDSGSPVLLCITKEIGEEPLSKPNLNFCLEPCCGPGSDPVRSHIQG